MIETVFASDSPERMLSGMMAVRMSRLRSQCCFTLTMNANKATKMATVHTAASTSTAIHCGAHSVDRMTQFTVVIHYIVKQLNAGPTEAQLKISVKLVSHDILQSLLTERQ